MKKRYVSRFNIYVSEIGFGGWQLANPLWGSMAYEEGINLVKKAYEKGINFFDTAPGYSNGLSERIIGEALKDVRENVFINTKFGHNALGETDFSEDAIERSINESLERLQTTYIDSVILHNPPREILEGKTRHEEEFQRIKRIGKIRGYGVSIDTLEELELVLNNWDVDVIEILFNIMHQSPKYLFDKVNERGILLSIKVPLDSGWLTGKYNANSKFEGIRTRWSQDVILKRAKIVEKIKNIVKDEDLVKYAIGFILSFDAVKTVITGVKNVEQLEANINASEFKLSEELKQEFEKLYEQEIKPLNLPW
jgi:aryl-alcohol dehydrogenase-like predicted oxidoreductase